MPPDAAPSHPGPSECCYGWYSKGAAISVFPRLARKRAYGLALFVFHAADRILADVAASVAEQELPMRNRM